MATLTLRLVKGAPLTNQEVDDNFSNLNDDKVEKNGTTALTGKLTLVASGTSTASLRFVAGSNNPTTPANGDMWNNGGVLKYYNGTATGNVITSLNGQQFAGDVDIDGALNVDGNVTFGGTTTAINSTNLTIVDNNITLANVGTPTNITANNGGFTVKGDTDKTFKWETANENFNSSENLNVESGKTYKINNTSVLSSTTLGTGVINSSLTSVGTITTGVWNGTPVPVANGGTGAATAANARTNLGLGTGADIQYNSLGLGVAPSTTPGQLNATDVILTGDLTIDDETKGIRSENNTLVATVKNTGVRFSGIGVGVDPTAGQLTVGSNISAVASSGALSAVSASLSTGNLTLTSGNAVLTAGDVVFNGSGKGLKDSQGDLNLEVATAGIRVTSLGVGTGGTAAPSGTAGEIRATNEITAYYASDRRLKENVVNITDALSKVTQINGVQFDWTQQHIENRGGEDGYFVRKHDVGIIAQEIEQILPEVVATREDGYKAVRYEKIVPLLIEAIKDLHKQIEELKNNAQ